MAKKSVTLRVCDLHRGTAEAVKTIRVALQGQTATLDVCDEHLGEVQETFKEWTRRAPARTRRSSRSTTRGRRTTSNGKGAPSSAEVRAWARSQGYELSNRGRIPGEVVKAFAEAH